MSELRDKILSADDIAKVEERVPEWGVTVHLQTISAGERARLSRLVDHEGKVSDDYYARVVVCGARDADGEPVFEESDIPTLNDKNGAVVSRLANKIMSLNRIGEDVEALAEKN